MNAELITLTLARAGEIGGDITPLVYDRLFTEHPDMRELFVRARNGSVRGRC